MKDYHIETVDVEESWRELELLFNDMAERGYTYVNSFPAECGSSGRIFQLNHIFVKEE